MMEALKISATEDSPEIIFDPANNIFQISKRSLPEDATGFYEPVIEWLNTYKSQANEHTHIIFKLEYFNTASAKQIYKILCMLEELSKEKKVTVGWYYQKEDKDMKAAGERYSKLLLLKVELVEC